MSFSTTSSIAYYFHGTPNSDQVLQVRFGVCSRLISRSPSPGIIPDRILQQTRSTPIGEALFPFTNVRDVGEEAAVEFLVNGFLRSFNLHSSVCQMMSRKILSFAQQFDANNGSFKIEANIDYMKEFWMEAVSWLHPNSIIGEEGFEINFEEGPPPARRAGAPESAIERVRKQKFDGFKEEEETGECCVCCEDLKRKGMEVSRIPCGHVYHKSCILTWLERSNTCPLCRRSLEA
ncbi:E3 ubiquitin-protein ligase DZIP3-like [Benincasa hispida]|uniref:E3 ubiquitin-protein ligase DZIP3-like n=1 Tax=Benincasa hispida TaxID=102211 RepID=UPI001901BF7D|nr:E3 ubiquitin-protein ligase DZIP3-like [Benincasa hispida]XP_038876930.1 E3 ubiquitin-protein ligase DZIP3-like [Benincasa hispida]